MSGGCSIFTASVLQHRGGFLFVLIPQQIPYRYTKVFGNLVCGFRVDSFLATGFKIRKDATAYAYVGTRFSAGDVVLGAEVVDLIIKYVHLCLPIYIVMLTEMVFIRESCKDFALKHFLRNQLANFRYVQCVDEFESDLSETREP